MTCDDIVSQLLTYYRHIKHWTCFPFLVHAFTAYHMDWFVRFKSGFVSIFSFILSVSSRVGTFVVGAELAAQSQQRRTTVHDTHSCNQHCLVLEQTSGS